MFDGSFKLNDETLPVIAEIGRHIPGGFFIYRAGGNEEVLYANQAVFNIYGCRDIEEFRELTGGTFKGMVHRDDYASVSLSIDDQIRGEKEAMDYVMYRIVRKDGSVRWVDDYGHYAESHKYGGVFFVFISDVTEKRTQFENDMAVRNAVIEAFSDAYHTVWLINDVETEHFTLYRGDVINGADLSDTLREELSHKNYSLAKEAYIDYCVAECDRQRLREMLSLDTILARLADSPRYNVNYLRKMDDGTERYYRVEFGKVNMPGGKRGVVCGFTDIDADMRQMLAQEKHQAELDSMITAMASDYRSVFHVDLDADDAVCYRADPDDRNQVPEGVHFPFLERFREYGRLNVDDDYRDGFYAFIEPDNIRKALATENIIAYRYLARRDGEEYYEMLRMAGVRHPADRDDHIVHAVGVGFTVIDTEMRQSMAQNHALQEALAAAEDANKAKTAFLSNMSHEIRTPMNAIIGLNNIALSNPDLAPDTRDQLQKIGESAQHLLSIINDILDMSRIESGRMALSSGDFSMRKALEQVNTIISGQCRDKGLEYESRINGKISDCYIGDEMKLRQILINILGNAVKFTPEGGSVTFVTEEIAKYDGKATLRFIMSDTGIGMSSDYLPKLFDTFSQENASASSKYGSTGLGMSITRNLVEMMNGVIDVESEKGVGTTFTVTVTLNESDSSDDFNFEDGNIHPHEMAVLVIDDDPIACEHARLVLGQVGVNCDIAASGHEGLNMVRMRHARRDPYNLILIDWKMPDMDGVETTRNIRSIIGHESAIIILTSYNWDDVADEAMTAGVDSFVPKPLFATSVMDEFREAFRRKNAAIEKQAVDLKGKRILLAEDMMVNAEIMIMVLAMREMETEHAENGKIAVDMFTEHEEGYYDAVLMDMRMPVMDGLEATRAIRASGKADAKTIPVIALTANAFDEDVQRSMQAGLNAHLSKPVEPDALFDTLENLIVR